MNKIIVTVTLLSALAVLARGHGRLREPPGRSTLWRYPDDLAIAPYIDLVEENYDDNALFCGGFSHQTNLGGKCGVCGDAYDAAVKENEAGGKFAKGIIVRQYQPGSWITAKVEITAHHKGYFEFRLCPWNKPTVAVTHECLDEYVLDNGSPEGTKWLLHDSDGGNSQLFEVQLKLPDGIECDQCVLQWKYHTGNSWGCDDGGGCCIGCGPQEEFYGCSDIAIGNGPILPPPSIQSSATSTNKPVNTATSSTTTPVSTTTTTAATTKTTTTEKLPPTTKTTTTTAESGSDGNVCQDGQSGLIMRDCNSFYMCSGTTAYKFDCPAGTVFNEVGSVCDHPYNVSPTCGTKGT